MDSGQPFAQEVHGALHRIPVAKTFQLGGDVVAQLSGITLAAEIHHAGIETAIAITAHEQAEMMAITQRANSHAGVIKLFLAALEQLVPGELIDNIAQMFAGVGALGQAGALQYIVDLATYQRNITGPVDVGIQGEQADIAIRPFHRAVFGQAFHRHHIHIMGMMNRRAGIGLGHHHQTAMGNVLCHLVMGGNKFFRIGVTATGLGQAQTRIIIQGQLDAVCHGLRPGTGIAEKGEMILGEPVDEGTRFGQLFLVPVGKLRREIALGGFQIIQHGRKILHHHPQLPQHLFQMFLQMLIGLIVGQRLEFHIDQ